jgi:hypothetical protein
MSWREKGAALAIEFKPMKSPGPLAFSLVAALALASPAWAQTSDLRGLHDALGLSAAQDDAWRAFQAASHADPQESARRQNAAEMMPTLTAPRRVDLSVAAMEAELRSLERRGAALKAFYATLTPAQQAIFDKQTAPRER